MEKVDKTCIGCGEVSFINKANYNSAYCRKCALKKENKNYKWDKVEKYIAKAYRRGQIDTRKEFKHYLINMLYGKFPQYKFLLSKKSKIDTPCVTKID